MKLFYPDIFRDFYCIGSECKDNCCKIGWDIEIDEDTYKFYESLDDDLGKKIAANIYDQDGCHYMGQEGGCPFLNEKGLCSVLLTYGEDKISDICAEHPRFYEWFGDYKEAGVGICCEKTCELLLDHPEPIEFYVKDIEEPSDDLEYDKDAFEIILQARNILLKVLQNRHFDLDKRMFFLTDSAERLQQALDEGELEGLSEVLSKLTQEDHFTKLTENYTFPTDSERLEEFEIILDELTGLEYIHEEFPKMISYAKDNLSDILSDKAPLEYEYIGEHLLIYFFYRYFLKSVRDFRPEDKAYLACEYTETVMLLLTAQRHKKGMLTKEDYIYVIKEFSKEVEYSAT